jgi:MFS family permease
MRPRIIFAAGFLILFVGGGARYAIGLTFKPMVTEFGWHRGELGLAVGAYLVVSALATYLAGHLADRMSPRLLLNAGVLMSALGIGLMSQVTQSWQALLYYGVVFAIGSGFASLTPVGVIITNAFPARTGFANAAVISGTSVGQLVIIAALTSTLGDVGWSSVFVWLAIAHLAIIPPFLSLRCRAGHPSMPASSAAACAWPKPYARDSSGRCSWSMPSVAWMTSLSQRTSLPSRKIVASKRCLRATCWH